MKMYSVMSMSSRTEERSRDSSRTLVSPPKDWPRPPSPGSATWRVRAGVTIPAGITIGPYPSEMLLGINTADHPKGDKFIEVKVKENTLVACPDVDAPRHWLLHVTPARDRHEQNVEAIRDSRGLIAFRIIKLIQRGQELLVWYGAELALECNIPILTPANIRSDQEYACTACDATFRYPNTLKAHVRFHCVHSSMAPWLGPYSSLQTGSILSAYQHELSKYFCQLGTLWNLKKMTAAPELCLPPLNASSAGTATRTASSSARSAFRPCTTSSSRDGGDASSPVFSPSQSPLMAAVSSSSRKRLGDKNSTDDIGIQKTKSTDEEKSSNQLTATSTNPLFTYPPITPLPSYVDKMYTMYNNYAHYLRSDVVPFPIDLSASLTRLPVSHVPAASDYPPSPSQSLAKSQTASGRRLANGVRREDSKSPTGEPTDSPAKVPVAPLSFPMPSDTAGEPIDLLPKSLYMSKAYKGHLCIYCGKLYSRKYGLKIHLRTHTGYKPLKCKVCLRPFGDPSNLNKHIRLHAEGDTPYRCEHCGKVLVRRRDLERHVKSRHPSQAGVLTTAVDEHSDVLCDTDGSFIDVDDDGDACASPIDMSRQEIEVT